MKKLVRTFLSGSPHPWSAVLVAFVLLCFGASSLLFWNEHFIATYLTANREQIFSGHEYWRLFTSLGIHADMRHFLSNSLFFFIFGYFIFGYFGVGVFPALLLILGALSNYLTLYFYPPHSSLMGASGMVYAMVGFWITSYLLIERGETWTRRLLNAFGMGLVLFFPTSFDPEVSYLAHASGMLLGLIAGCIYFNLDKKRIRSAEVWKEVIEEELIAEPEEMGCG